MLQGTVWGKVVGLRDLRPTDAASIRRMVQDPEVADLLFEDKGGPLPSTLYLAGTILAQRLGSRPDFGIVDRGNRLIGVVRLWRVSERNKSAMLTIFIGGQHNWGRGYGTEAIHLVLGQAFGAMGLNRVELHVFDFNERAIRCYEKAGFVWEGVRRQALLRKGKYHDIIVMGILREEHLGRGIVNEDYRR